MTWLQLRLYTQRDSVAALEDQLLACGAVAVTLEDNADQPLLEPGVGETPLWNQTRLTGLYPADSDMHAVLAQLPAQVLENHRVEILEDKDWAREWMQHFQPMRFGEQLWVCPSWLEPPHAGAVNLLLDPGLAFGTGTHPTTAMCLRQLDGMPLRGQTVVDYGCGSGILAVAALKLGAARALGVDNDPQALTASAENSRRNGVQQAQFKVALPQQVAMADWGQQADLVVANILSGPLVDLSDTLISFLKPGGDLLMAGLLSSQSETLRAHYTPVIQLSVVDQQDDWVCLRGKRPSAD